MNTMLYMQMSCCIKLGFFSNYFIKNIHIYAAREANTEGDRVSTILTVDQNYMLVCNLFRKSQWQSRLPLQKYSGALIS